MKSYTILAIAMLVPATTVVADSIEPDLKVVTSLIGYSFGISNPLGTPDEATIRIVNDGTGDAPASHVKICSVDVVSQVYRNRNPALGQGWCGSGEVPPIPAGGQVVVTFPMPTRPCEEGEDDWYCYPYGAMPGLHQKCAIADSKHEVAESDETNNVKCNHYERTRPSAWLYLTEEVSP